ncbi:MAG TPA: Rad52/Rad22 family DNA repair protein [Pyrinomonadaceae bacterium]|jgi:hypothetical protein
MAAENQENETVQTDDSVKTSNKIELRSIRDIIKDLRKPISPRHLRTRKQGGKELTYISWHDAIKYLDHYAPGWCYEVRNVASIGGRLVITVRISIPCSEGMVWREATGQEEEDTNSFGDPSSNAESMALRRACTKFGLGLYLYQ